MHTYMDMRGEHKVGDAPPHPQWVMIESHVESPSSSEAVLEMVAEANDRCPVTTLVRKAVPIYEQVHHNGMLIRDTVPVDLPGSA